MVADAPRETAARAGVVLPSPAATSVLRPLGAGEISIASGFWSDRLRANRERTIPHGFAQLEAAGTLDNFRLAAGAHGRYRALGESIGLVFPFLDSDVYKWLEAVGWELGRGADPELARMADEAIALVAAAQRQDGYLNTFVQVVKPGTEYEDLAWGHESYCIGHLIQAAVAWHRALGDDRLLDVATRATDSIDREFGPAGRLGVDGHPEIEMALVELFRVTGERRYLDLAARMVEARGHGILGEGRFGPAYWQDHASVRDATSVAGHAVRQLYLDCGVVDVATELGDRELLGAVHRRWRDMVETNSYITGGLGSRHLDESFGDPFELPPDRAYAETCAAIASVMLAWRLLLATGDPACADVVERTIYNAVLPGLGSDAASFFYVNTLQRRTQRAPDSHGDGPRKPWHVCACCPPNLMRTLSSWEQYVATRDEAGIQVHQFATGEIAADVPGGRARLAVEAGFPWNGAIRVTIVETPATAWTLSLRRPAWAATGTVGVGSGEGRPIDGAEATISETRAWQPGDVVTLTFETPVRLTEPDARVDAIRGCVAVERGPLVYCVESADLPPGTELESIALAVDPRPRQTTRADIDPEMVGVTLEAVRRPDEGDGSGRSAEPIEIQAIPYYAWANRGVDAMRIWIPAEGRASGVRPE